MSSSLHCLANALTVSTLVCVAAGCAPATDAGPNDSSSTSAIAAGASASMRPPAQLPGSAGSTVLGTAGTRAPLTAAGAAGSGSLATGTGALPSAGRPGFPMAGVPAVAAGAGRGQPMAGMGAVAQQAGTGAAAAGKGAGMMTMMMTGGAAGAASGGSCGDGTATDGRPTTGPLACIVEQHNATRAMVKTATPLPPFTWDAAMAKYAQEWTDMTCMNPMHRSNPSLNGQRLGENLYASGGVGDTAPGKNAVDGWSGEVSCYTFGAFMTTDKCDMQCTTNQHSDGCGHYTQVVWRDSTKLGCGVTTCGSGFNMRTEVICNYGPAGNFVGMNPY